MIPSGRTYLDHNATSPLRPETRVAMLAALDLTGNAASVHAEGRRAREIVERARDEVAALVGAKPEEVVFTSGATEANNWVMRAGWDAIVTSATEHDSVLAPAHAADPDLIELPSNASGLIDLSCLTSLASSPLAGEPHTSRISSPLVGEVARRAGGGKRERSEPTEGTRRAGERNRERSDERKSSVLRNLASLHLANAETGVIQPVAAATESAHANGFLFHTDAVQAAGRIPIDFATLGIDLLSLSAHKIGGPQGIGALVIRDGLDLPAFITGGGQQRRRRSGTENVAAIAGFGAAAIAARDGLTDMPRINALRDRLESAVREITPHAVIIGAECARLPNTSCIATWEADAATLLIRLDLAGIAVSAGSACSSGKIGGSHVLAAMGIDERLARSAIRVSLGPTTTPDDIEHFLAVWKQIHRANSARMSTTSSTSSVTVAAPPLRSATA